MTRVIEQSDLLDVLDRLPEGFQTRLGEGGGLVSGGEGQRVRLARALLPTGVRLALMDEPFRGLDRHKRRRLLERLRSSWAQATMLCVTHDVADTQQFDRVLVIEDGTLIEDGAPQTLMKRDSRYRKLVEADELAHRGIWSAHQWRRITVEGGKVLSVDSQEAP